jgi:hypothetical protein
MVNVVQPLWLHRRACQNHIGPMSLGSLGCTGASHPILPQSSRVQPTYTDKTDRDKKNKTMKFMKMISDEIKTYFFQSNISK